MDLHLTINGKLIDSIPIDKQRRRDKEYLENKKLLLKFKYKELTDEPQCECEFYLDPVYDHGFAPYLVGYKEE